MQHRLIFDSHNAISGVTTYADFRHRKISGEAAKDYSRGQAKCRRHERSPRSSGLEVLCALPWSEAERQGASMVFNR